MSIHMAIQICFYRYPAGFMLLEQKTLNVFKLVIFNIQCQLCYSAIHTIRKLPSLKINLVQSSMNTQTQFNTWCYSSRKIHSEKFWSISANFANKYASYCTLCSYSGIFSPEEFLNGLWINLFLNLSYLLYLFLCDLTKGFFCMYLKKMCILFFLDGMFYILSFRTIYSEICSKLKMFLLKKITFTEGTHLKQSIVEGR